MPIHIYTAAEIAELSALADDAREIEAEARDVLAQAAEIITRKTGGGIGWQRYHPELSDLADAICQDFRVAPYSNWMPAVGQFTTKLQRAAEWQKLNRRARREIANVRKAIIIHA